MKITGIKHQWGDQLLKRWGPDPDSYNVYREYDFPNYQLLTYLETIEGPDLWVGTSHSMMNFNARDAEDPSDHVPSLAWIHASRDPGWYLLEYPMPQEFCPWFNLKQGQQDHSEATVTTYTYGVESTAEMLLAAIAAAETNPGRTRADWLWYICSRASRTVPERELPHALLLSRTDHRGRVARLHERACGPKTRNRRGHQTKRTV